MDVQEGGHPSITLGDWTISYSSSQGYPGWGTKGHVNPSSPVASLLRFEGSCTVTYPSGPCLVLVQGDLQVLMLQESRQGNLHQEECWKERRNQRLEGHCAKHDISALHLEVPASLWRKSSEGIVSPSYTLFCNIKSQSETFSVLL